ncbi:MULTISPECIES: hypothetical protein [unclassified Streptomyces]|uniref:hypothetical protein n=1 Tax=unclassified Streptomyces TaxID=2593676 RepID=UPI0006AF982A|nr:MULTISPECIES: hypothetical protein [unclassified Streptomyces]KOX26948.1 hypothetical protein ADL06_15095 [Streptomyces sp. NRRL F-6491]KOX51755.1 hypothetical protein ADL08_03610 [Streptomyces sp. NRRL F-6492]
MRRALSSTVVCTVLLTAGCAAEPTGGGSAPTADAAPPKTAAPLKTAAPATTAATAPVHTEDVRAALEATGRTTARTAYRTGIGTGTGPAYVITGEGAHDFARHRGTMAVGLARTARFEEVFTDERIYLRGTVGDEKLPWSYIDRADVEARHLLRPPGNDPAYVLEQAAMGERFERTGEEDLGGIRATRYRGLLTHAALTLRMTERAKGQGDRLRELMGGRIPATVEVWLDERKRAVRVRLALKVEGSVSSTTTLALTGLGEPVKVTVPTAEDAAGPDSALLG